MLKDLKTYVFIALASLLVNLQAAESPIANGFWVKLKANAEGIYRLDYQDMVNSGFDMNALDPRNLKLLGHGGGMLPEDNGTHQPGLPEIPIFISGEEDGKFDGSDFLLFYAGGVNQWSYNPSTEKYEHIKNLYTDDAIFYLGYNSGAGKRVSWISENSQNPDYIVENYYHLYFHDSDLYNPVEMGRNWLGEKLGNETLKRNFSIPVYSGALDSSFVKLVFAGAMKTNSGNLMSEINGQVKNHSFDPINEEFEAYKTGQRSQWVKHNGQSIQVNFELLRPNTQSSAWVDYFEVSTSMEIAVSKPVIIRNMQYTNSGVAETRMKGSGVQIWDVSNVMNPQAIKVVAGSGYEYFRTSHQTVHSKFAAFNTGQCLKPELMGKLNQQNILAGSAVEFIIITHPDFIAAAQDLASFRKANDGYSVKVVQPQQIYNEYNTGQQDIVAIRDYLKDEYQKSLDSGTALKYVLLMGSTSYDPKNRISNNTNFIPVYQSPSFYKSQSFCLDDFYGYFDSSDGNPASGRNLLSISVGRIPCRNVDEAWAVVNKLKRYDAPEALGPWRSEIGFVCDDVDDSWELEFIKESEKYSKVIDKGHADLLLNKIYTDAYKQVSTGNTEKYPDVSSAINRTMENGALFLNYQGHGGEKGWAQEGILNVPMINAWNNKYKMPVLFTATCEFSRYDNPGLQSGGELALLNPNGGAIALMTTTRLVFVSGNSQINYDFWTQYGFPKPSEPVPTLGTIYQRMKNRPNITSEDNKFALLGDPSMTLAFPENHVVMDSVNGQSMDAFTDTLKAFSVVKIKGHIEKRTGGLFSSFNGNLWVKVFDKPTVQYTLDNDKNGSKTAFTNQNSYIYKGVVSVNNGKFEIVFAIPKDISYRVDSGKISTYAHNGVTDANGAQKLLIGGSLDNVTPDNQGPEVSLFMNDTTFMSGGTVESDAIFIANVMDSSGINSTGAGIGRDIIAVLDEGTDQKTFILNDYFNYDLNSYIKGKVSFPMSGLSVGKHSITFKVWDIHNNSTESVIEFTVLPATEFVVSSSLAKPNPFRDEVYFEFTHNLSGENIVANLVILDQTGREVGQKMQNLDFASSTEDRLQWNGVGSYGNPVGPGMYYYKIMLEASDGRKTTINGKLIKN